MYIGGIPAEDILIISVDAIPDIGDAVAAIVPHMFGRPAAAVADLARKGIAAGQAERERRLPAFLHHVLVGIRAADDLDNVETQRAAVGGEFGEFIQRHSLAESLPPRISQPQEWRAVGMLEVALSQAFVDYAKDIQTGQLVPSRIDDGMVRIELVHADDMAQPQRFELEDGRLSGCVERTWPIALAAVRGRQREADSRVLDFVERRDVCLLDEIGRSVTVHVR